MRRKCAWCGLVMGANEPLDNEGITHGICLPCGAQMLALIGGAEPTMTTLHQSDPSQLATHKYGAYAIDSYTGPRYNLPHHAPTEQFRAASVIS
jgi:hypothetical protein